MTRTFVQVRAEAKQAWIMPNAAESLKATFVQVRAEAKLAWIMPNAAESRKAKRILEKNEPHRRYGQLFGQGRRVRR